MRFSAAFILISSLYTIAAADSLAARAGQDKPKTTWDGVYTEAQAKRGEEAYSKTCASCHGPDLAGVDTAPSLSGTEFNADWNDLTLDDLLERVRTTMPADAPGSLGREQYVDIIAFILARDSFPAGAAELPAQEGALKEIKFVAQKPPM